MQTIPVSALQNPEGISELCHKTAEPVRVEVDGRNDLVVMSLEVYRRLEPHTEALHLFEKLMNSPQYDFDQLKPSMLPKDEAGVYVIFLKDTGETLYVGRTKKLRRRLYTNHLMGPEANARLKKYLVTDERYPNITNMERAKEFIREQCAFRYLVEPDTDKRGRLEGLFAFLTNVRYIDEEH